MHWFMINCELKPCCCEYVVYIQEIQDELDDAGASLHVSQPASQPRQRVHSKLKRGVALIFNLKLNVINVVGC
jgi:hypothetical protein